MDEVAYIAKGDKRVNGQYRFVSHDQVVAKLHPYLARERIVVIPTVEQIQQEGNRTLIWLHVHFVNAENPQETFCVKMPSYGVDSSDKGPGKAISYAFKYVMLKLFCLETGEDPDFDAESAFEAPVTVVNPAFEQAVKHLSVQDRQSVNAFVDYCASVTGQTHSAVEADALTRMESFLQGVEKWKQGHLT